MPDSMEPGQRSKADRTRDAIMSAARRGFQDRGFERTTVRWIAAEAGVDPALVVRYFGSKQALFERALDPVSILPRLEGVRDADLGKVISSYTVEHVRTDQSFQMLLRAAVTNPRAAELLTRALTRQTSPLADRLSANRRHAESVAIVTCALVGFAFCELVGVPALDYDPAAITDLLAPAVQYLLFGAGPQTE